VDDHQRSMWTRMLGAVNDFRAGGLSLGQLVSDVRGYFVEADPHGSTTRSDFELMWSPLDGEDELRTEPWAPPGAALGAAPNDHRPAAMQVDTDIL
jgi:hypothetical protein